MCDIVGIYKWLVERKVGVVKYFEGIVCFLSKGMVGFLSNECASVWYVW
jgi:hypothetical protein